MNIDWDAVSKNLKCPQCGDPAHIRPGTDGTEGFHEHYFTITREHAMALTQQFSKPSYEALEKRVAELEARLSREGGGSNER